MRRILPASATPAIVLGLVALALATPALGGFAAAAGTALPEPVTSPAGAASPTGTASAPAEVATGLPTATPSPLASPQAPSRNLASAEAPRRRACDTPRAPKPFPAPAGAAYLAYRAALNLTGSTVTGPGLDAALPAGCVIDNLGYNPLDGYLYGLRQTGRADGPELVRIGRTGAHGVAATTIASLTSAANASVGTLVADIDGSGRYSTLAINALTRLAMIQRFDPATGRTDAPRGTGRVTTRSAPLRPLAAESTAVRWDPSCLPALNNVAAQERLHAVDPTLPSPERLLADWAYNPADGVFYGYGAVDTRDEYLGKTDPTSGWTIRPLPDQVVAIDPANGSARCAGVSHPHPPGGVDRGIIGDTFGANLLHGSAAVGGAAFVGPHMLVLYESDGGRRWRLNVSTCFRPVRCAPTRNGRSAGSGGDAAGNPYSPAQLTLRALTRGTGRTAPLALTSDDLEPGRFGLGRGEAKTFDVVPGVVTVRAAGAPADSASGKPGNAPRLKRRLAAVRCDGGEPHVNPVGDEVRLTVHRQERLVCTFEITPSAADAATGPMSARALRSGTTGRSGDGDSPLGAGPLGALPGAGGASHTLLATLLIITLALSLGGGLFLVLPWQIVRRGRRP